MGRGHESVSPPDLRRAAQQHRARASLQPGNDGRASRSAQAGHLCSQNDEDLELLFRPCQHSPVKPQRVLLDPQPSPHGDPHRRQQLDDRVWLPVLGIRLPWLSRISMASSSQTPRRDRPPWSQCTASTARYRPALLEPHALPPTPASAPPQRWNPHSTTTLRTTAPPRAAASTTSSTPKRARYATTACYNRST